MFIVMTDGALGERAVPNGRGGVVIARPGVPFDVDPAIAGEAPGEWETTAQGDVRDEHGHDPGGVAFEQLEQVVEVDGVRHGWRVRRLGHGLLAQENVFRAATDDEVAQLEADGGAGA